MDKVLKIEIGAGNKPRVGYKSCDIRELPGVDYICSAENLPFENNSVDEIYSRHVVEHFTLKEFLAVLKEWNRVLKSAEGEIYIICPNLLWHLKQILDGSHDSLYVKDSGKNHRYWGFGSLFGWQQNEYDVHKFGYYFELMKDILMDFGFDEIEDLTNSAQSLEKAPWHLEVKAKKKNNLPENHETKFHTLFDVKH